MSNNITHTIIHHVGNKSRDEGVRFYTDEIDITPIHDDVMKMINRSFKFDTPHQFYFEPILTLNPVYNFVKNIFENPEKFAHETQNISSYLYEKSSHGQIKAGEVWVMYIENCKYKKETVDAICIIKSENKESVFQLDEHENGYDIVKREGLNLNKIDKGCLIYNTQAEEGYVCSFVDASKNDGGAAKYWHDNFLHVRPIMDEGHKAKEALQVIKSYICDDLSKTFKVSKSEKASMVNAAINEINSNSKLTFETLKEKVFTKPEIREDFERSSERYQAHNSIRFEADTPLSKKALKGVSFTSITTIRLDDSFTIKISGTQENLELGFDEEKQMKFYKLYFNKEQ